MKTRHLPKYALFTLIVALLLPVLVAQAEFGTNWTAQFYNNRNLSGDVVATQSGLAGVNFTWQLNSPAPGVNPNEFSARFSSVQIFAGGTYEFTLTSDDGARVFIDGQLVFDRYIERSQTTDNFTQVLTAGNHSLTVEYFDFTEEAMIQFQWVLASPANPAPVQPGVLPTPGIVPTGAPTGPQASIVFVRGLALRTGPYLGASMITALEREASYPVLGRNLSEGENPWYLLQTSDGRQGWASGVYLTLNVDPNTIPEVGSIFDQINDAPDVGVLGIPRANMVLRQYPSLQARDMGRVPYGEPVQIIGRTLRGGVDRWYQVRRSNGEVGWIFSAYVTVDGNIRAVPIR